MRNKKQIVIFAGPSGSGKDSIMEKIIEKSDNVIKLTTATTRKKRDGEKEGESYYFLSEKEFKENIKNKNIPEYNFFSGNYYGTYLPDLEKKLSENKVIFSQIQLVGAKYLKKKYNALLLFFVADSFEILEERIRSRGNLTENEIKKRISIAKKEVEEESKFYDYIIENKQGKMDETIKKVLEILEKEKVAT